MHEEWEVERTYQVIRGKNRPKITWSEGLEREKWVWEVKSLKSVEWDQGSEIWNRDGSLYRNLIKLDRSRAIKKLLKFKTRVLSIKELTGSYRGSNKRFSQQRNSMDRGSYRAVIEETESFSIDQTRYRELSRMR